MSLKHWLSNIRDNLLANWIGTGIYAVIVLVLSSPFYRRLTRWQYLILLLGFAGMVGTIWWVKKHFFRWSPRTRAHWKRLAHTISTSPHMATEPLVAKIASESAQRLMSHEGEDLTMEEYRQLLEESQKYIFLEDVTLVSCMSFLEFSKLLDPSNLTPLAREARIHFENQKVFRNNRSLRMRRIFVQSKSSFDSENGSTQFDEVVNMHKEAKIDLLWLDSDPICTGTKNFLLDDMCIFVGTGSKASDPRVQAEGWIVWAKNNYLFQNENKIRESPEGKSPILGGIKGIDGTAQDALKAILSAYGNNDTILYQHSEQNRSGSTKVNFPSDNLLQQLNIDLRDKEGTRQFTSA